MKHVVTLIIFICLLSCKEKQAIGAESLLKNIDKSFIENPNTIPNADATEIDLIFQKLPNNQFSMFYLKKHPNDYMPYHNIRVNFDHNKTLTIEGAEEPLDGMIADIKESIEFSALGKPTMIHLNLDENTSVKEYLDILKNLEKIKSNTIHVNNKLFIYDKQKLPQCDCDL